jgi:hypothetical protein
MGKNERGRLKVVKTASFVFVPGDGLHAGPCVRIVRLFTWGHAFDLLLYFAQTPIARCLTRWEILKGG